MFGGTTSKRFTWRHFTLWLAVCAAGIEFGLHPLPYGILAAEIIAGIFAFFLFLVTCRYVFAGGVITLAGLRYNRFWGLLFRRTLLLSVFFTLLAVFSGLLFYFLCGPYELDPAFMLQGKMFFDEQTERYPFCLLGHFQEWLCVIIVLLLFGALVAGAVLKSRRRKKKRLLRLRKIQNLSIRANSFVKKWIPLLPFGLFFYSALLAYCLYCCTDVMIALGRYSLMLFGAGAFFCVVVLPLVLCCHKIRPFAVFKNMLPALLTALFTRSSILNMPLTLYFAENKLNTNKKAARFVLPLCSFINMNSGAVFTTVTLLVLFQNYGEELDLLTVSGILLFSLLAVLLSLGYPMAVFVLNLCVLWHFGLPIGFLGAILLYYRVLTRFGAAVHVWSDSCIYAIVERKMKGVNGERSEA